MASQLIQILFKEEHRSELYPFARPYFNDNLTIFFENEVIKEQVLSTTMDKIAVCSWKLRQKLKYYIGEHREITQEVLQTDYDVLSFTRNTKYHQFFNFGEVHHKGFKETIRKMLDLVGIPMPSNPKSPIYQNAFSARREIYQDYVNTYLIPCMNAFKNDPELNALGMVDSNYHVLAKGSAADAEYLQSKIGVSYYPMIPFLLERLFSIYCHNKKINVTQL